MAGAHSQFASNLVLEGLERVLRQVGNEIILVLGQVQRGDDPVGTPV
jgi:hypothetical protein